MTLILGKRKRRSELVEDSVDSQQSLNEQSTSGLQNLFRQHFEAAFEPLDNLDLLPNNADIIETDSSGSESGADWNGFSEDEDNGAELIYHSNSSKSREDVPREEFKTFMTTKPPSSGNKPKSTTKWKDQALEDPDEASTDAANLKKDLALQRLLKESHLLDPSSSLLSHSGQNRHKALDLRLQDMGSKSSIFTQQKMPLAQRKGIKAKAAEKEDRRRRAAKENGIVLEKAVKGTKREGIRRERGVGAPSVGRFQRGMLKLSKKDVAEIEGSKKTSRGRR